jgi:tetracycline repressor-like protein
MTVGRPREFDPDEVLETAMELFWEHGFDGVSISDLTDATGINRRSLYAAFGSKEELFGRAVPAASSQRRCGSRRRGTSRRPCFTEPPIPTQIPAGPTVAYSCTERSRQVRTPTPFASTWRSSATRASRRLPADSTKHRLRGSCPA